MARTISVADDVYRWMKRHKGERSFSELIRDLSHRDTDFHSVNGMEITGDMKKVDEAVAEGSETSMQELRDTI